MFAYLINLFWIIVSLALLISLILLIILIVLLAWYLTLKEEEKAMQKPAAKLTFDGPSRMEMTQTTARLLKEEKKRKYRRPYFQRSVI